MRVLVIGGSGHTGKYLVPMLAADGHDVIVMTTGRTAVPVIAPWDRVAKVQAAYSRDNPAWQAAVRGAAPEAVIDFLGADSAALYACAKPCLKHLVVCGSLWMWGEPRTVPTPESVQGPCLFPGYARRLAEMLALKDTARADGIAFTAIMPPNICGPGKIPLETSGGRSIAVHKALSRGEEVVLPAPGSTLIGPCDAEDIAQAFHLAVRHRDAAAGEFFNVGSACALTSVQFAQTYGDIYGVKLPIRLVDWSAYIALVPQPGAYYHFQGNMCPDIRKLSAKLGYKPKHTCEETMGRAVGWMKEQRLL